MIELDLTKVQSQSLGPNHEVITVAPLPPGYGMTIGNAFRRILLSSIPGAAVTGALVHGVSHEFSVIPGVRESVLDILLNLKLLRVTKHTEEAVIVKLKASKPGPITAGMLEHGSEVEIVNPDLVIANIEGKAKLEMDIRIESGAGYFPAASRSKKDLETGFIAIDALFSPIKKVRYGISNTRVGQQTNLDKLDLEVETDGSVTPRSVVTYAARLLSDYASLLNFDSAPTMLIDVPLEPIAVPALDGAGGTGDVHYTPVETLKVSPRTLNALINNDIGSVEELLKLTAKELENMKGFGKKALEEVVAALSAQGKVLSDTAS